ncbi:MAG TPA: ATP-binding protein [Chloroflexia bacterium]|nr:ATP-binding protein [Chloroflexia bacterium]
MPEQSPLARRIRSTQVLIGVLVALVTTLAVGGILATLTAQVLFSNSRKALAIGTLRQEIRRAADQMELATRDYILTGDTRNVDLYREAEARLPGLWDRMAVEIGALEGTQPVTATTNAVANATTGVQLRPLVESFNSSIENWKSAWANAEIERTGQPAPVMSSDVARRLLAGDQAYDSVRQANDALDEAVRSLIVQLNAQRVNVGNIELWLLVVLGIVSVGSGFVALRTAQREAHVEDEARERVENERRRLQAVIDNLPVPVRLSTVPDSRVILQNELAESIFPADVWNRLDARERTAHFKIRTPDGELLGPEEMPVARVLREGRAVHDIEFTASTLSGTRHMLTGAAPITDEDGQITAAVVVMQDVTRMRELDQRKDEFIATAAHELRNPLTALSGHHQLLQRRVASAPEPDPAMVRHVQVMGRQITRLTELIERLLDASRIQLGRLVLDLDTVDLAAIARTVVSDYQTTDDGHHPIEIVTPPQVVGVWDGTRLEEVLSNLVGNALRYTPDASPVRVEVEDEGTWVRVSVSDRGPGIPHEQRERLFDRYYQTGPLNAAVVEAVTVPVPVPVPAGAGPGGLQRSAQGLEVRPVPPKKQGLGLGLYISSEIVKAHGGQIGVDANVGGGSTFWFRIPKARSLA